MPDTYVVDPQWPPNAMIAIPDVGSVEIRTVDGLPQPFKFVRQSKVNGVTYNVWVMPKLNAQE